MNKIIIAAVMLLLISNVIVLAGVAYNRSGAPLLSIQLTERELPISYQGGLTDENSGISLQLRWNVLDLDEDSLFAYRSYNTPAWLDDARLTGFGFDVDELESDKDRYQYRVYDLQREVFLVLEYDGASYRQALESSKARIAGLQQQLERDPDNQSLANQLEKNEQGLSRLQQAQSRLFVIDGGLDKQALLQQYADHENILLTRGIIALSWNQEQIEGRIQRLSIEQIHVPLPLARQLAQLDPQQVRQYAHSPGDQPPRYRVQLNLGKRLEPWLASVALIE